MAILLCSAGAATANPGDRVIARRDVVVRPGGNSSPEAVRVQLKSDVYTDGSNRRALVLIVGNLFSGSLDVGTTDFVVSKFTVQARRISVVVDVVWRRVGSSLTRELAWRFPINGDRPVLLKKRP